ELSLGLLIALDRRIPQASGDLHAGGWNKSEYSKADGLYGRTLGVVGVGIVGAEVISRARALGMRIAAWSRSLTPARAESLGVEAVAELLSLPARCAAVSVHLALTKETRGLIGRDF